MKYRRIILFSFILTILLVPLVPVKSVEVINKPIVRPLPTLPAAVLVGETLQVEMSGNQPTEISANLVSSYDDGCLLI